MTISIEDHKWLDPECGVNGCQSLVWKARYEAAVNGRREFRQAYRDAKACPDMTTAEFRRMFETLHNMDLSTLEESGVITPGARGGSDWERFNNDLTTFVLKLPADRLGKLAALVCAISAATPTPVAWIGERELEFLKGGSCREGTVFNYEEDHRVPLYTAA